MKIAVNKIILRLILETSRIKNGPEIATTSANILTKNPACVVEIPNFSLICGNTPTIPISVVIIPNTPIASVRISKGFTFFIYKTLHSYQYFESKFINKEALL
ncbi:Uncharacterised protein [Streptococcus pneumoniae]|nr:Uncharacterised protein [Streptococcus pneumoniae]